MVSSFSERWFFVFLTRIERLIYSLFGSTRADIRLLIYAIRVVIELHLVQHIPRADIPVTKTVYPQVAQQLGRSAPATARSIERLANLCWDEVCRQGRILELFGREYMAVPSAADVLYYLAYFIYFNKPFFVLFDENDIIHHSL